MGEHEADGAHDQDEVNLADPPMDLAANVPDRLRAGGIHVHFALHEIVRGARVAFAAGCHQVGFVDAGAGVGGGQDLMHAVAARAIGGQGGAVLRGQAVIAVKEGLHAVRRQVVLGVHPLGGVAVAADVDGDLQGRTALEARNLVFRMAIGAGGSLPAPGGDRLAVNAFLDILGSLLVAGPAGLREPRAVER